MDSGFTVYTDRGPSRKVAVAITRLAAKPRSAKPRVDCILAIFQWSFVAFFSVDEDVSDDVKMYKKVLTSLVEEDYDQVLATCEEALNPQESHSLSGQQVAELTLIRGTFYILSKQQDS